jgi:phage tail P2-like protein
MRLLPYNSTPQEIALEAVTEARLDALPVTIKDIWNVDACPDHLLSWLAWALSVDVWGKDWTDTQKRNAIRQSAYIHKHKGTIGAVKRALSAAGFSAVLIEQPAGNAYTFSISINVAESAITEKLYETCLSIVNETKNVRSHLIAISLKSSVKASLKTGSALVSGNKTTIYPYAPDQITLRTLTSIASVVNQHIKTTIYPLL